MNRYMIVCRLRWPAILLLTGVIALLDQAHILSWGHAWPLYLILWGVLALAERAVLASDGPPSPAGYSYPQGYPAGYPAGYAPQPGAYTGTAPGSAPPAPASTGIVPAHSDLELRSDEPRKSWEEEGR
jgi:hypothetical protein